MTFQSPASQFDAAIKAAIGMTQKDVAAFAKAEHAKVMRADPKPLNYVRHVDGREAPEEAVKPGGVIVYDYNRLDRIAEVALDLLRKASPVKSGDYVRGHTLYLNLTPVETLKSWKPGDEVSITNTVPYARVIEVGKRGGTVVKFSMPPHVYEKVARALMRQYREMADIQFSYRAVLGGGQVDQLTMRRGAPTRNKKSGRFAPGTGSQQHNKAEMRWPTITINPKGSFSSRAGLR